MIQQDQAHASHQCSVPPEAVGSQMRQHWRARGGRLRGGQDHSTGSREDGRHEEMEGRRGTSRVVAMAKRVMRKQIEGTTLQRGESKARGSL